MKPTVYIETTVPSLLTSRLSKDIEIAGQQVATRQWWDTQRENFDLYISPEVLAEAAQGDPGAASLRLQVLSSFPVLETNDTVEALTRRLLATNLIPPRAIRDATHIAFACAYELDFLLTWNCRHIHNAMISKRLAVACAELGFSLPVICTPSELMIK